MKIAYLLLAHIEPPIYKRLIDRLTSDGDFVFLHIDKKVDSTEYINLLKDNKRCVIIENRVEITWGGFNMIQAFLNLAESAIEHDKFDRFYFLSGLEYPLYSNKDIHHFFEKNPDVEFINAYDALDKNRKKNWAKYYYYWDFDNMNLFKKIRRAFFKILYKIGTIKIPFKGKRIKSNGHTYHLYDGWTTISLTNDCMKYVLEFDKNNPAFKKYFTTVFAPDESYIHTIIFNSKYKEKTPNKRVLSANEDARNLTYFEYPDQVKIFKYAKEYDYLKSTRKLFFRKAKIESVELLDYIDSKIDKNE